MQILKLFLIFRIEYFPNYFEFINKNDHQKPKQKHKAIVNIATESENVE